MEMSLTYKGRSWPAEQTLVVPSWPSTPQRPPDSNINVEFGLSQSTGFSESAYAIVYTGRSSDYAEGGSAQDAKGNFTQ